MVDCCLMWLCGYLQLLESSANVLYVNPAPDVRGGTALHEATRNRHEALAELLLSCGAYPFQCNYMGRTCMDEAVLAESVNLLRRYEQAAPWQGTVAVKVGFIFNSFQSSWAMSAITQLCME
jgi:hypothetical protein